MGLDASRDRFSQDTGSKQHLIELNNCTCDWRGQIVLDPEAKERINEGEKVTHVRFYATDGVSYALQKGSGITLKSDIEGHEIVDAYPRDTVISSTVFNQRAIFLAQAEQPYKYDGAKWSAIASRHLNNAKPAFGCSVNRRVACAGIIGEPTKVILSRVDDEDVFPDDEPDGEQNVLRAGYIDISNLQGTANKVTGLSPFEQDRLAIFTEDKTFIYKIDPDITLWEVDDRANINVGCLSHNTIVRAGVDVLFCSRSGVHSVRRSQDNGILVYSLNLSDKVEKIYRKLVKSVGKNNYAKISAVFDLDEDQYHIFFPKENTSLVTRLTLSLNMEQGETVPKWSTSTFLNASCGDFMSGQLVLGTPGGIYDMKDITTGAGVSPTGTVLTPVLWHGSIIEIKETEQLILQASGKGNIIIEAFDTDTGLKFFSDKVQIEPIEDETQDDNMLPSMPLTKWYERPFKHRYRGVQFKFTIEGTGEIIITGFAVKIRR